MKYLSEFKIDSVSDCAETTEVKKSKFVAIAAPVNSVEEAMFFFKEAGDPKASHNCWAYR